MQKRNIELSYANGKKRAGTGEKTLVSVLTGATSKYDVKNQINKIEAISKLEKSELPDIISDLSLRNSAATLYDIILEQFPNFIVSTLPIYQCTAKNGLIESQEILSIAQQQMEMGVGMITIHPTPSRKLIELSKNRLVPCTSRGGSIVIKDFLSRNFPVENAYIRVIDDLVVTAKKHGTVISIGASFRSANIFDSLDDCQLEEFIAQKNIADYIYQRGVQVIIEGPGHSSPKNIKKIAGYYNEMNYPVMPLGPIPTDTAVGQDHISSSIGAVLLGIRNCADIITSVTREEHTGGIPSIESSIEAIKAAKIAAHIIDLNNIDDYDEDLKIANYRSEHNTCVYGKKNSGCSRCANVCPLKGY